MANLEQNFILIVPSVKNHALRLWSGDGKLNMKIIMVYTINCYMHDDDDEGGCVKGKKYTNYRWRKKIKLKAKKIDFWFWSCINLFFHHFALFFCINFLLFFPSNHFTAHLCVFMSRKRKKKIKGNKDSLHVNIIDENAIWIYRAWSTKGGIKWVKKCMPSGMTFN